MNRVSDHKDQPDVAMEPDSLLRRLLCERNNMAFILNGLS